MMEMTWVMNEQGQLCAQWIESDALPQAALRWVSEDRVYHRKRAGGPPGQQRIARGIFEFVVMSLFVAVVYKLVFRQLIGRERQGLPGGPGFHTSFHRMFGFVLLALTLAAANARAQESNSSLPDDQKWNLHIQSTVIAQGHPSFSADYSGANSMAPGASVRETVSFDAIGGVRLWRGGEFFADVIIWQGYGLSNTLGLAAFPNGEAFRVGKTLPDAAVARGYFRQTIGLGGGKEADDDEAFQLRGSHDVRRLVFTVGHLSAKDLFDNNAYANDARSQFMNWSLEANDAWDYPANTLGFTNGATLELDTRDWSGRLGIFQVSKVANGLRMDWNLANAWSLAGEAEHRHSLKGHTGAVRLFAYDTRAHMGNYQDTLNNPSLGEDIALTAGYRYKYGFGLNFDQEVRKNLGIFARVGWTDGKNQTYEFTDVDRTATGGLSLKGAQWRRPQDTVGVAVVVNGLSAVHREYLAAGGLGITIGDGGLDYATEKLVEAYYNWQLAKHFRLTPDYQFSPDPAYNRARGPVSFLALRLHTEF